MKKVLAFVLCLMMALSLGYALAEAPAEEDYTHAAELLYEGVWVQFEDGFEIYLPADWYEYECTEEMNAQGIFYMAGTEDMSYSCTLGWTALEAECTIEELHAEMVKVHPEAQVMDVSGVGLVFYVAVENGLLNYVALDATEPGAYLFAFSPANDEVFLVQSAIIASTIRCF